MPYSAVNGVGVFPNRDCPIFGIDRARDGNFFLRMCSYTLGSYHKQVDSDVQKSTSIVQELVFATILRAGLIQLDKVNHRNLSELHKVYSQIKSAFIRYRVTVRPRIKEDGPKNRLKLSYEIESDMDKFVRSKQQGTDPWEWAMLAVLGATSIVFIMFLLPAEKGVAIGGFLTVKIPVILISGVIGYLGVKLRKLEGDRKNPILGMTNTTGELASKVSGSPTAYFGVVFKDFDEYAKHPFPFTDEERKLTGEENRKN